MTGVNAAGRPFEDASAGPPAVRGHLHGPAVEDGDALVLTHGAGTDARAPLLVALAEAFGRGGVAVLRCDLPFRQTRRTGPPRGTAALDRQGLRHAALAMRRRGAARLFLGGHSYGARQASLLAAEDPTVADGLLLLAYPLRPPRGGGAPRSAHFPALVTPALFVHGSRDPFGSLDALGEAIALIPAPTRLLPVEGAGHDLGAGRAGPALEALAATIVEALLALSASAPGSGSGTTGRRHPPGSADPGG